MESAINVTNASPGERYLEQVEENGVRNVRRSLFLVYPFLFL